MPGHDGAPVFDNAGQLVGFAVYGLSYCPDQQCFGTGTVRSIKELWQLLDENNIKLSGGNADFASWKKGVNEYMRANYVASADSFGQARDYAFNRWAEPLQKLARTNQGTQYDTSFMNQLQVVMIVALVFLAGLTMALAAAFIVHRKRINMMQVGHYGAVASAQAAVPGSSTLPPPIMNANSPSTMQSPVFGQPAMPVQPQPTYQQIPAPTQPQVPTQLPAQPFGPTPVNSVPPPDPQTPPQANPEQKPLSGAVPPSEDPFYK